MSRPRARTRGLKQIQKLYERDARVASSREDAWIETYAPRPARVIKIASRPPARTRGLKLFDLTCDHKKKVASSREDAWIETQTVFINEVNAGRVLPRGRVD